MAAHDGLSPLDPEIALEEDDWVDVSITGGAFAGQDLEGFRMTNAHLVDCDLSGAVLIGASMWRVTFERCRMSGAVLDGAELKDVTLRGCKVDTASLRGTKGERIALEDCVLREADLTGASWSAATVFDCDLRGATLTDARLAGARFHGSSLEDVIGLETLRGYVLDPQQGIAAGLRVLELLGVSYDEERTPDGTASGKRK